MIEDIDSYNLLSKMLFDLQMPTDSAYGKMNLLAGTRNDTVVQLPNLTAGANYLQADMQLLDNATLPSLQINSGEVLTKADGSLISANNDETQVYTFCLNLVSLIGSLCQNQYFPLFACSSAPLRVEIQLVDSLVKAGCSLVASIPPTANQAGYLQNVEYIANFIELGDQAMAMIYDSLGGEKLQFVVPAYRNYPWNYTLATVDTQIAMPIPCKFSSLKAIFVTQRDQGQGALTYFPHSSVKLNIKDYQFRVGSQIVPAKAPNTITEMFSEVLKAIGSMSDINHQPSIEKVSYSLNTSTANTLAIETNKASNISSGSFYIGLDLENYSGSLKDSLFAGTNTNTDDVFLIANYGAQAVATSVRFDAFANFDTIVTFESNTCYITF
jgi:hypothetical protein